MLNIWERQERSKQELTPIIAIVFYPGKKKWTTRKIVKSIPEELGQFVPTFEYVLFEETNIQSILFYLYNVSGMVPEKIDEIMKRPLQYFHSPKY